MKARSIRPTPLATRILAASIAALLASPAAFATSGTWLGTTDNIWTNANWSATPPPTGAETATFSNDSATVNGRTTISLAGITIQTIVFDTASAAAYTLGSGAVNSQTFTLSDGVAAAITMNSTVANDELFNATINLGTAIAGTYTITNNSTTNTLSFAGTVQSGTGGTAAAKILAVTGSGNTSFDRILRVGSSTLTVQKTGAGTATLGGTLDNSSVGATVSGGVLLLSKASTVSVHAIGTNSTVATGGTLRLSGTGGDQIFDSNVITVNGGVFDLNGKNETIGALAAAAGAGTVRNDANGTTSTLTIGGMNIGTQTFAGVIADNAGGGATGIVALAKTGTGTLTLNGANTYSGDTTVNGGTLSIGASGTLGGNVGGNDVVVNAGANLTLAAAANIGASQILTINSSATALGGIGVAFNSVPTFTNTLVGTTTGGVFGVNTATFSTAVNLSTLGGGGMFLGSQLGGTYTAGTLGADAGNYRLGGGGGTLTINTAVLTGAGNNLTVHDARTNGGGTVILGNAANTFDGTVTINAGTLSISDVANTGNNQALGTGASAITLGSTVAATLLFTGATDSTNRDITLGSVGGTINVSTDGAILTLGKVSGGSGSNFTKTGPGSLVFTSATASTFGSLTVQGDNSSSNGLANAEATSLTLGAAANTFTGFLSIGTNATAAKLIVPTSGSLTVNGSGQDFNIGSRNNGTQTNQSFGILDASAASGVTLTFATIRAAVDFSGTTGNGVMEAIIRLPNAASAVNAITATTAFTLGDSNTQGGPTATLNLGGGTTTITTPTMLVGGRKSNATVTIAVGGSLTLNNGVNRTTLSVASGNVDTGTQNLNTQFNLTGGTITASLGLLTVGSKSGGGADGRQVGTANFGTSATSSVNISTTTGNAVRAGFISYTNSADAQPLTELGTGTVIFGGGSVVINSSSTTAGNAAVVLGSYTVTATVTGGTSNAASGTLTVNGGDVSITSGGTNNAIIMAVRSGTFTSPTGNTSTGTLNINGGSLTVNNAITGNTGTQQTSNLNLTGGLLNMTGKNISTISNLTFNGGTLRNLGTLNQALTQTGESSVFELTGAVAGTSTITGAYSLTDGTADIAATRALSVTAGTTVSGTGALIVNGSISGSLTTVSAGSIISGTGTIGAGLTLNGGTVAPGNSAGPLTVTGDTTFGADSIYAAETAEPGTSDLLSTSGILSLATNSDTLALTSSAPGTFTIASWGGTRSGVFDFYTLNNFAETGSFAGNVFTADSGNFFVTYSPDTSAGDIVVTLAVPEPGALVSLLGGLGMLVGLQRFRRRG